jgi:SAM-dependent methyltransferase
MTDNSGVKQIYTEHYSRTESLKDNFRLRETLRFAKEKLPKPPQCMLDVGCGDGFFTSELGRVLQANKIYGVDISAKAVSEAKGHGVEAIVLDTDENNLPFGAGSFDFIFCGNLIELVFDPDRLLLELHRVLAEKGHLVISFPNLSSWANRIALLLGFQPYYDIVSRNYDVGKLFLPPAKYPQVSKGFVRLYTLRAFKKLAGLYGFKIIQLRGAGENTVPAIISFADRIFSKVPAFAFQVICLMEKK